MGDEEEKNEIDDNEEEDNDPIDEFVAVLMLKNRLHSKNLFHIAEIMQDLSHWSLEDLMKRNKAELTYLVEMARDEANKYCEDKISQAQIEPFVDTILGVAAETGVDSVCESQEEYSPIDMAFLRAESAQRSIRGGLIMKTGQRW